jgi:shikimate dehydrogenase
MTPTLCGVLGHPVGHSRSPAIQNAAFEAAGLDWRYVKLPVPPERFEETVRALPASGYRGANVTIPHKLAALRLAGEASPAARAIGAANTLTFADGGAVAADNTDAGGILDALARPVAGLRALVLGAGGAGRAAVYALREAGAAEVMLWNRTADRAVAVAHELGAAAVRSPGPADVLVHATSVGLDPATPDAGALAALGLDGAEPYPVVVDLVYRESGPTPVEAWARATGSTVVDGIEVLVRQGARSFESWTGRPAPLEAMRAAARKTSPET